MGAIIRWEIKMVKPVAAVDVNQAVRGFALLVQ